MDKYLINRLDTLWSILVKMKDGKRCVKCGSIFNLSSHHIHARRKMSVRWDLDNGVTLCDNHHTKSSEFSAHLSIDIFRDWIIDWMGVENYDQLEKKANNHYKFSDYELKELLKMMTKIVKEHE